MNFNNKTLDSFVISNNKNNNNKRKETSPEKIIEKKSKKSKIENESKKNNDSIIESNINSQNNNNSKDENKNNTKEENNNVINNYPNLKFYPTYNSFISLLSTWQEPLSQFISPPNNKTMLFIYNFIKSEYETKTIFPPKNQIFSAFQQTPFSLSNNFLIFHYLIYIFFLSISFHNFL